jgi:hypothetical protein
MVGAQDAAGFIAAGIQTAIELLTCVLFNGSEGDELGHKPNPNSQTPATKKLMEV